MKTLVSQEIFANIGLRKQSVLKSPQFWIWANNENILEYAQIAQSGSIILHIESHSSIYLTWFSSGCGMILFHLEVL